MREFYPYRNPIVVNTGTVKRNLAHLLFHWQLISSFTRQTQLRRGFLMTQRIALVTGGSRGLGK
ncbi:short-chain dehydrogenase, partial [Raoultella ornithinolytica]